MSSFIKDWTEKEIESLTSSFKRYRIFVFILKFVLPISAAVLLVMVIFFAEQEDKSAKITVENVIEPKIAPEQITSVGKMKNPRFQGLDTDGQPYSIVAEEAWQESSNEIRLQQMSADITTGDGKWISTVAGAGQYFVEEGLVNLSDNVDIFITGDDGAITQVQSSTMTLDIKNGNALSESDVSVISNLSNFSASGFVANRDEEKISFTGPIKLVIVP